MTHAFARTETKDQNSIRDDVCSILHREGGLLTKSETRRKPIAVRPPTSKRRKTQCDKEKTMIPSCSDGRMVSNIGSPKQFMVGLKSIAVTCTISQLLTYHMSQHGNGVQDAKTVLVLGVNDGPHLGSIIVEMIVHLQLANLQLSNENKDE